MLDGPAEKALSEVLQISHETINLAGRREICERAGSVCESNKSWWPEVLRSVRFLNVIIQFIARPRLFAPTTQQHCLECYDAHPAAGVGQTRPPNFVAAAAELVSIADAGEAGRGPRRSVTSPRRQVLPNNRSFFRGRSSALPSDTQGRRSYGTCGGGRGTFIVHMN
jgi:hypothetical protein